ncbi:putative cupin-like domain containing protein [Lyophyllum shimeji]|uniref:Cupin-like domain containing protein n=1 Tax=Lyophyllum shimeji TaxID=47721 RepID=A0A9P3UJ48_LYOSH|nr:putative cupin-like domain containing protein [Lyophyllum shimeji]
MVWHLSYIRLLTEELSDLTNPLTAVLLRCDQVVCDDLRSSARNIVAGTDIQSSCAKLESVINTARKSMASLLAGHLLAGWIRLFADASILGALADIAPHRATQAIARFVSVTRSSRPQSAYLRSVSGPGRVVPVEVGEDYRDHDWTQKLMDWDEFLGSLDLADQPPPPKRAKTTYLAQHNLLIQFPSLRADIIIPDYVYACMDPPGSAGYRPPGNEEQLLINMWLGPQGTVSPAHTDPYYNLFVQVVGRKTVWLAPPNMTSFMYPYSSTDAFHNAAANSEEPSMSNTSRVDVFSVETDEFPEFWNTVVPEAKMAILEPGDLLYIPPGWWHAMRSEETSFSVSLWF